MLNIRLAVLRLVISDLHLVDYVWGSDVDSATLAGINLIKNLSIQKKIQNMSLVSPSM